MAHLMVEYKNVGNHMLWHLQFLDPNTIEHLWEIMDQCLDSLREYLLDEW